MSKSKPSRAVSEAEISAQDRALLKAFLNTKVVKRPTPLKQPGTKVAAGDFTVISFKELVVRPFQPRPCHRATESPLCAPAPRTSSRRGGYGLQKRC